MSPMTVPNTQAFRGFLNWLHEVAEHRQFGFLRTADGVDFVVMRPEQLAELDAILSDPAFATAVEAGAADVAAGRVSRVARGLTLDEAVNGSLPCDGAAADDTRDGTG